MPEAAFSKSFPNFPCNDAWAEKRLEADSNIFKQPQRPLDQSLILKFSNHRSKVSTSSPNVMVLCFEATSGYRLNIVYNLCCPVVFSIDWPGSAVWFPLDHFDMPERDSHASNSRGKILQPGGSFYNIASKSRWVDMLVPLNTFVAQLKM